VEERRKPQPEFQIEQPDGTIVTMDPAQFVVPVSLGGIVRMTFDDLFSSINRSRDFNETRADYLRIRLIAFSILTAVLLILWIPVDFVTLEKELASDLAWLRVLITAVLVLVVLATRTGRSLCHVQWMLAGLVVTLNLFTFASKVILEDSASQGVLFGYSLFPYLYIAMLSIFPHTVVEGVRLSMITVLFVAALHLYQGSLNSFSALSDFWFLSLLSAVALWAQIGQMQMLLRLYRQATRDSLTGLYNRARLMTNIEMAVEYVNRSADIHLVAIMMFDLDKFKKVNDTYGHLAGDDVLKCFAEILRSSLRTDDVAGRYGGAEFVALLANTKADDALAVAERIRRSCESALVKTRNGHQVKFTTSIGIVFYQQGEQISALLDRADDNLYKAKFEGRNRVVLS